MDTLRRSQQERFDSVTMNDLSSAIQAISRAQINIGLNMHQAAACNIEVAQRAMADAQRLIASTINFKEEHK
jgi:hypothetical protein